MKGFPQSPVTVFLLAGGFLFSLGTPGMTKEIPNGSATELNSSAPLFFNASLLQNLPQPVQPPAEIKLPPLVIKNDQWRGAQCGVTETVQLIFRDSHSWDEFWEKAMAPYSPRLKTTPFVDFSKNMIVGVFRGERPFPVDQAKIVSVKVETSRDKQKTLVVRYQDIDGLVGVFTPRYDTYPFHLRKVAAFDGNIVFLKSP
jgi:hypothetical protein